MTLQELLTKRQQKENKKLFRYAKYIFNDHFVVVLLFLFGALSFQYAAFIKTIEAPFTIGKWIAAVIMGVAVLFGTLQTDLQQADSIFLSAKEQDWQQHLERSLLKSILLPAVVLAFAAAIVQPLLLPKSFGVSFFLTYVIALLSKYSLLRGVKRTLFFPALRKLDRVSLFFTGFLAFVFAFLFSWIYGLAISILVAFHPSLRSGKTESQRIDWEKAIHNEEARRARLYRIINLFTDAPIIPPRAKRRKYADSLVQWLSRGSNPYQYVYARTFVRSSNYSSLYVRLLLIGGIVLWFSTPAAIQIFLGVLFLYLTGFQLAALYGEKEANLFIQLYAAKQATKASAFRNVLFELLSIEAIVFSMIVFLASGWKTGVLSLVLFAAFVVGFIRFYLARVVRKKTTPRLESQA